ncbi:ZC3H3 [Branchiostoma lanceolatum]|uniref:ZC3H3 protein n=1 Tax=Branchiostoma lanceolatum TaxID=7740 RepID=A0A8K0A9Z4_BRALA|nr:ZC3H3 [Branchiostoma lanceolatum]
MRSPVVSDLASGTRSPEFDHGCIAHPTCTLPERVAMPVCSYFLRGVCNRDDCPYSHVYVSRNAQVCQDFVHGYCPRGKQVAPRTIVIVNYTEPRRWGSLPGLLRAPPGLSLHGGLLWKRLLGAAAGLTDEGWKSFTLQRGGAGGGRVLVDRKLEFMASCRIIVVLVEHFGQTIQASTEPTCL